MLFEQTLQLLTSSSPTKQTSYKVGVKLLEAMQTLLKQIVILCDSTGTDITQIDLFKRDTTSVD